MPVIEKTLPVAEATAKVLDATLDTVHAVSVAAVDGLDITDVPAVLRAVVELGQAIAGNLTEVGAERREHRREVGATAGYYGLLIVDEIANFGDPLVEPETFAAPTAAGEPPSLNRFGVDPSAFMKAFDAHPEIVEPLLWQLAAKRLWAANPREDATFYAVRAQALAEVVADKREIVARGLAVAQETLDHDTMKPRLHRYFTFRGDYLASAIVRQLRLTDEGQAAEAALQ